MPKMTKEEQEYQAQWDFETLTRVEEIKADKERLNRAIKAGEKISRKNEAALKSVKKTASKKIAAQPKKIAAQPKKTVPKKK